MALSYQFCKKGQTVYISQETIATGERNTILFAHHPETADTTVAVQRGSWHLALTHAKATITYNGGMREWEFDMVTVFSKRNMIHLSLDGIYAWGLVFLLLVFFIAAMMCGLPWAYHKGRFEVVPYDGNIWSIPKADAAIAVAERMLYHYDDWVPRPHAKVVHLALGEVLKRGTRLCVTSECNTYYELDQYCRVVRRQQIFDVHIKKWVTSTIYFIEPHIPINALQDSCGFKLLNNGTLSLGYTDGDVWASYWTNHEEKGACGYVEFHETEGITLHYKFGRKIKVPLV